MELCRPLHCHGEWQRHRKWFLLPLTDTGKFPTDRQMACEGFVQAVAAVQVEQEYARRGANCIRHIPTYLTRPRTEMLRLKYPYYEVCVEQTSGD